MSSTGEEVTYLVTTEDIAHLNHHFSQTTPAFQRSRRFGVAMIMAGALLVAFAGGGSLFAMSFLVTSVILSVLLMAGRRGPTRRQVRMIDRLFEDTRNRVVLGRHQMKLLPEHIEVATDYSRGEVSWEGVERVTQDESHIYIYVSALNAYVINKRYFPTREHAKAFFDQAWRLHNRALELESARNHGGYLPAPQEHAHAPHRALPAPHAAARALPAPSLPAGGPSERRLPEPPFGSGSGTDGTI